MSKPSMRPRLKAAENRPTPPAAHARRAPSMRPRLKAAENADGIPIYDDVGRVLQ